MRFWPVPASYSYDLPRAGEQGSFWEDRGNSRHTGVDIYAPEGSPVIAVADGIVLQVTEFTTPNLLPYYNQTHSILIKHFDGAILHYAHLGNVRVSPGEIVSAGDEIGALGAVLNFECVDRTAPRHIRNLKRAEHSSILHLEMYDRVPEFCLHTIGGNALNKITPDGLLDPTDYLTTIEMEQPESVMIPA